MLQSDGIDAVREALTQSEPCEDLPVGFRWQENGHGIEYIDKVIKSKDTEEEDEQWEWLCSAILFVATMLNADSKLAAIIERDYRDRKMIVFCPLRATSRQLTQALQRHGLAAAHVYGESRDRTKTLKAYADNKVRFLLNASLLTEGYDDPSIDTVLVLRQTRSRTLLSQMIGRGTRLFPGKDHLLVLDPLFQTEQHNLVSVADLVSENDQDARGRCTHAQG